MWKIPFKFYNASSIAIVYLREYFSLQTHKKHSKFHNNKGFVRIFTRIEGSFDQDFPSNTRKENLEVWISKFPGLIVILGSCEYNQSFIQNYVFPGNFRIR